MKTTIAPPILTLVEYGSVIGSRRYQPVLFVASTALSVCLQHSVSELRSDRSGSLPAGSITNSGISGPAHSPEQYDSGTVTFSYFVPRSLTGQTYRRLASKLFTGCGSAVGVERYQYQPGRLGFASRAGQGSPVTSRHRFPKPNAALSFRTTE